MKNGFLVKLLTVYITNPFLYSHRTVQLTAGIEDRSSYQWHVSCGFWKQEKTSFIWGENHNQSWTVHLDREENSVQFQLHYADQCTSWKPWPLEKIPLMLNRKHCVDLHVFTKNQIISKTLFVTDCTIHFNFTLHFGRLISKHNSRSFMTFQLIRNLSLSANLEIEFSYTVVSLCYLFCLLY